MLFDVDAVAGVMQRALAATSEHAVWAQTSTVGVAGTQRLAELAGRYDRGYVDAPVLGTKKPAEQGELIVGGGTDSPYAQLKGKAMIAGDVAPAFGLAGAVKDPGLIVDALREAGDYPVLMRAVHHLMSAAADAGHAGEDMAAVVYAFG